MALTSEDFLLGDFQQKISYLANHLRHMWTRFNFFVSIESALIAVILWAVIFLSSKPLPYHF